MKAQVTRLTDWQLAADVAARTQRIQPREITPQFLAKLIVSEHSPLRVILFQIDLFDVPYYVHVHLVRHKVGVEFFVRSQRPDSTNPVDYDRAAQRQDAPIDVTMVLNLQALLNIVKVRLCAAADPKTQEIAQLIRQAFLDSDDELMRLVGKFLRPRCEWSGGYCREPFRPCGKYPLMLFHSEVAT